MNISALSIRHPVPALLLFALLTLLGVIGFRSLGIQYFPDLELPSISVSATLEGAAASQLETEVARKLEDAIATLGGIKHIHTTLADGQVNIGIEFEIDKAPEVALDEVRNAVDSVRSDLPQDLTEPVVARKTTAGRPFIAFTVASQGMDEADLSWFVDNEVSKAILAVQGVGKFKRIGGIDREIQVDLDPVKLAALGLTAADVLLQAGHSGGRGDLGGGVQGVRTLAAAGSAAELAALDIPTPDGRSVPLAEIAAVRDGAAERSMVALLDGRPVVAFELTRIKGWSEVEVAARVRAAMAELQARHPGVVLGEAYDSVAHVQESYRGSMQLLYEGALLAVVVVWWFLRDWRATLVSAAALQLSIIPTFLVMKLAGFSLDTLTLLALAVVVGILVDDAIVEIENIVRHQRMGKSAFQASLEAADEIGLAVVATTLTLVAVFLPTAFMGGVPGEAFRAFGITTATAVFTSLLVARLLTPMMAAYLLSETPPAHRGDSALLRRYLVWVSWCLGHRKTTLAAALLFFAASIAAMPLLPKGFIPASDWGQTMLTLELAPGSSLQDSQATAERATALLREVPEVVQVFAAVGVAPDADQGPLGGGSSGDVRKTSLTIKLSPREARDRSQAQVEDEIRQRLRALPGTRVALSTVEPGAKLRITLASEDAAALDTALRAVEADLRTLQGLGNITSDASLQQPEIQLRPDFARAAELGVTAADLARTVRIATAGDYKVQLPKLNLPQRQLPIRVRQDLSLRGELDAIRQLPVRARTGTVPLEAVAEVSLGSGPSRIDRLDRMRNAAIDVELNQRVIGDVLAEADQLPALRNLPASVVRPLEGDTQRMQELFSSFSLAIGVGVLCIYIVLVLLFHDFLQPFTILVALPLSLGGAIAGLLVGGKAFSMPAIIGILMLMGIVTKNSILLVDYAIVARRRDGMSRLQAVVDACHKRAQPILMTTIAMGAGMLPVALGLGADPSFRSPMGVVVVGGLITSTLLSLLVVPVVFTCVDDAVQWLARRVGLRRGRQARVAHVGE